MASSYSKVKFNSPLKTRVYNGYAQFFDPKTKTWVFVHRRVAEKKIGGKIGNNRVVHHIDGDKKNNRAWNLKVMSKQAHDRLHGFTK